MQEHDVYALDSNQDTTVKTEYHVKKKLIASNVDEIKKDGQNGTV